MTFQVAVASFSGVTVGSADLTASNSFPDYPTAVRDDDPLFYHRLDDAPGSTTAADSSGNAGMLPGVYGGPAGASGTRWLMPFDEGSGSVAHDLSGRTTPTDGTFTNATWAAGHSGTAASFNGTNAYVDTSGPVIDTSTYFTISAWLYIGSKASDMTAISQVDSGNSAFRLGYLASTDKFTFSMTQTNTVGSLVDRVSSTTTPALNRWYHVSGVYEPAAGGRLNLYVNGRGEDTAPHTTAWNAAGVLEIGAARTSGSRGEWWNGRVDDARYNGAINWGAAANLAAGFSSGPSSSWDFGENAGPTTADRSGATNTGTLGSGASWTVGRSGGGAALDGTAGGYVDGRLAPVDTSASFTVSAWVNPADFTMSRTVVSQSGAIGSAFMLKYNHYGDRWEFATSQAESYTPVYDSSYGPHGQAALSTWVHLVGVYDGAAGAQTVTLYVDGVASPSAPHTSVWKATGPLQAGRVREFGTWQLGGAPGWGPMVGSVDDVRTYPRALSPDEVARLYNGGNGDALTLGHSSLGVAGALQGSQQGQRHTTAQVFNGDSSGNAYNPTPYTNPSTFSMECWFRTVGPAGTLIDFGSQAGGNSTQYGRRVFVSAAGNVVFGANSGVANAITSPGTYLDGNWHHVVATLSPASGMALYLDGVLVGSRSHSTVGNYTGFWRWGGQTHNAAWPSPDYIVGVIDEVAVYDTVLSSQQVARHFHANH